MFFLTTISTLSISSVSAVSESNISVAENTTVSNQAQAMFTCYSCSNFLVGNETSFETCIETENYCFGMYCFALLNLETLNYFTGCINVTDNIKIVEFGGNGPSFCRYNGSYSECICGSNNCNSRSMGRLHDYFEGEIFSTLKFDLAKKAVLVTAAQLADIDQQEEVKGVRSIDVDSIANVPSTPLENLTTTMSSTTHSNVTSSTMSAISSSTHVAVSKHSESIFFRDYGFMTVFTMIFLAQIVLAIHGA